MLRLPRKVVALAAVISEQLCWTRLVVIGSMCLPLVLCMSTKVPLIPGVWTPVVLRVPVKVLLKSVLMFTILLAECTLGLRTGLMPRNPRNGKTVLPID